MSNSRLFGLTLPTIIWMKTTAMTLMVSTSPSLECLKYNKYLGLYYSPYKLLFARTDLHRTVVYAWDYVTKSHVAPIKPLQQLSPSSSPPSLHHDHYVPIIELHDSPGTFLGVCSFNPSFYTAIHISAPLTGSPTSSILNIILIQYSPICQ